MTEEQEFKAIQKRNVLVGIQIDSHSRELLSWALVKVAEPGDCVIAVQVCKSSGNSVSGKNLLDNYLGVYGALCSLKKVELTGQMSTGISVRKTLVKEAKNHSAVAVVVGIGNLSARRGWASTAKYCAKRLPPTTNVLAIHNGKILFRRCNNNQLPGRYGDPKPSFCLIDCPTSKETQSEFAKSEPNTEISSFDRLTRSESEGSRDLLSSLTQERKKRMTSSLAGDILDQRPGWPLLRKASSAAPQILHSRKLSVVQWVMSWPDRSPELSPQSSIAENLSEGERSGYLEQSSSISSSPLGELENDFEILPKTNSSSCKCFSYQDLRDATNKFFSGNMIGKGGCNRVYKGLLLQDGKPVAVKVQKSSPEARKDFAQEVTIVSSLNHKHITRLVGICIEDTELISVYDFFSKGSLEENLHGEKKNKSPLSWEVRYNISVKIAEALNHLHDKCSRPVIHRDVKSSNILLSDSFEPQLSDFGLAVWGPTTSSFLTHSDVVGTFGYLAPEYFMYGKVSDKIDVYAFGVVLLELLSGRKPIASENSKGQESLVMWAKPLIESANVRGILDSNLGGNFDEDQMQRMVLAAALCIRRSARLRPNMNQILKVLRGDKDMEKLTIPKNKDQEDAENQGENDDEVYPNSSAELHLSLALLGVDDDSTSFSSSEQGNNACEGYLKERWSRSPSFN